MDKTRPTNAYLKLSQESIATLEKNASTLEEAISHNVRIDTSVPADAVVVLSAVRAKWVEFGWDDLVERLDDLVIRFNDLLDTAAAETVFDEVDEEE